MTSITRELTSSNQCHGPQGTLVMIIILIATTMVQVSDGITNLKETKSIQINLVTMSHGKNSMICYRSQMERPLLTHLIHLTLLLKLTQIATGHLQKLAIQSLLIHHSAHLQYQAQLLLARLAPRPMRIVLYQALKNQTTEEKREETISQMSQRNL